MNNAQRTAQALADIVELVAPGSEPIRHRLAEAVAGLQFAHSWETAGALLDAMYDVDADLSEAGMIYCDWRSEPSEIRDSLVEIPSCPPTLNWEWLDQFDEDEWEPEEIESFLWLLAARCRELGTALIILDVESDGYGLGFVAADRVDRIVELARIATCDLRVVYPEIPTLVV
ncbi:hypothetical protein ACFWUP_21800 [Nocardia sp. NPDC058658]|uniref:DUF6630 family protein n=1 Tax=Nocardia sp. NPDC058658 TaxID=3346580 RepID=UPI00365DAF70